MATVNILGGEFSDPGEIVFCTGKLKYETRAQLSPAREMRGSGCG
ncbi:hypothetical protein HMPREF9347_01715 [Escherichia coli MS 124-1]|nr:hypothetical protein HMPREF9347_01715 [Escherichia coli MS 124-1]